MSKTLGNGIDPLELIEEYGADALKFTLAFICAQGQDILIDKESFKLGSKFANKLWNASRYILMNLEGRNRVAAPELRPVDRWIYSRLGGAARTMAGAFEGYRYNEAAAAAYEYFWNDFCDWYVEATKLSTKSADEGEKDRAVSVLLDVLCESLKLLHPLLPFVTEEIYGKVMESAGAALAVKPALLMTAAYPAADGARVDGALEADFDFLREIVRAVRTIRSECTVPPEKKIRAAIVVEDSARAAFIGENEPLIALLANLRDVDVRSAGESSAADAADGALSAAGTGFEAFVFIGEAVDVKALVAKWKKENEKDVKYIIGLEAKLANENFIKNAPAELVEGERVKLNEAKTRTAKTAAYIAGFKEQKQP